MPSSTSHSELARPGTAGGAVPWLAICLVVAAVAAWVLGAVYTVVLNPEIRFFKGSIDAKRSWARKMAADHGAKSVVYGGSSCAFSIDAERLLARHQLPAVNMGLGAGMGAGCLSQAAIRELAPGDTLIIALEPALLTEEFEVPPLAIQFSYGISEPALLDDLATGSSTVSIPEALLRLRPGGYHLFTLLGKLALGQPLYRYRLAEDVHPGGWTQTPLRLPIDGPPGHHGRLSASGRAHLRALKAWCDRNEVRVAYSLPWGYTPVDEEDEFQRQNAALLLEILDFLPVLRDPVLGAYTRREHFADTVWHLTAEGSAQRTDSLASQLKKWDTWTPDALRLRGA